MLHHSTERHVKLAMLRSLVPCPQQRYNAAQGHTGASQPGKEEGDDAVSPVSA
jgi:hypothetical protein